jgi:hypothetical protein
MRALIAATVLSLAIGIGSGIGTAFAEDPAPSPAPAAAPADQGAPPAKTKKPKMSTSDKKAISKACSDQANAKGLHGEERKKFRADCKKNGGKPM